MVGDNCLFFQESEAHFLRVRLEVSDHFREQPVVVVSTAITKCCHDDDGDDYGDISQRFTKPLLIMIENLSTINNNNNNMFKNNNDNVFKNNNGNVLQNSLFGNSSITSTG